MSAETAVRVKIEPCEMDTDDNIGDSFQNTDDGELEDGELVDEDIRETEPESADKLTQRARRFGLLNPPTKKVQDPEVEKLHRRMGVDSETRTEAVHLYGTDTMKTQDIFAYFSGYSPASIEWLTDKTCNVSWLDETACAKALKNCSVRIKGQGNEYDDSDDDEEEECVKMEDIRCALPPGVWRKGRPSALAPSLFIRYAKRSDRKGSKPFPATHFDTSFRGWSFLDEGDEVAKKIRTESSNPWVDIAKQWSYYENRSSQNAPPPRVVDARDVLTVRDTQKFYRPPDITKRKMVDRYPEKVVPAIDIISSRRMQADIEERKLLERKKRLNHQTLGGGDLRERLARKRKFESDEEDDGSDPDVKEPPVEEPRKLSLRIEIDNTRDPSEDEWEDCNSTHSSDSDEIEVRSNVGDLRSKLRRLNPSPPSSSKEIEPEKNSCVKSILRTKYIKHKSSSFSPLRIEIDNDNYCRSDEASD